MRSVLAIAVLLAAASPAAAGALREPSCNILVALMDGARMRMIETSFGRRFDDMTIEDFDQALGMVGACIDSVAARPPDRPGLFRWELRTTQLNALSILSEELNVLRSRAYEKAHDRRAASSPAK